MKHDKKILILLVLFVLVSVIAYQLGKQKNAPLDVVSPKQEHVVSKDETKSACDERLENLPGKAVEKFEGTPKLVDFTTLSEAKTFYTVITKAVASGSNFAGHFTLAGWGCGTDCFGYAIIDTKTGEIVTYSVANDSYHLQSYSLDSRVLVLEPVYAGQERKYYKIVEVQDGKSHLELACTEISSQDMYGLPE